MTKHANRTPSASVSAEFLAFQTIVECLDRLPEKKRGRVLLALVLIVAPDTLTESQVINAFRKARAE